MFTPQRHVALLFRSSLCDLSDRVSLSDNDFKPWQQQQTAFLLYFQLKHTLTHKVRKRKEVQEKKRSLLLRHQVYLETKPDTHTVTQTKKSFSNISESRIINWFCVWMLPESEGYRLFSREISFYFNSWKEQKERNLLSETQLWSAEKNGCETFTALQETVRVVIFPFGLPTCHQPVWSTAACSYIFSKCHLTAPRGHSAAGFQLLKENIKGNLRKSNWLSSSPLLVFTTFSHIWKSCCIFYLLLSLNNFK